MKSINNNKDKDIWCEAERAIPAEMRDYLEKRADFRARRRYEEAHYGQTNS